MLQNLPELLLETTQPHFQRPQSWQANRVRFLCEQFNLGKGNTACATHVGKVGNDIAHAALYMVCKVVCDTGKQF